jgi:hypothetical protein
MLPGDTHLSMSSSCEDPTQNLTPFLEQHQGEASTYWFFVWLSVVCKMVGTVDIDLWQIYFTFILSTTTFWTMKYEEIMREVQIAQTH